MFKTLNKVLLALLAIVIISYFLQNRANTPEACANIEGFWNSVDEVCENTTEEVIFQSLSKPNPLSIIYPENQRLVVLDKAEQVEQDIYLRGHYEQLLTPAEDDIGALYDRGSVFLNMSKLTLLANNRVDITYFSAPFVINTAGSGVYVYVGLFSYDFTSQKGQHLSSELLGHRIREEEIVIKEKSVVKDNVFVQEGLIQVNFKSSGPEQSVAEYPTQVNQITLQLVALDPKDDKNASFRRITTMHETWDVDHDGINDCEKEGSCDHTVDYSQVKPD